MWLAPSSDSIPTLDRPPSPLLAAEDVVAGYRAPEPTWSRFRHLMGRSCDRPEPSECVLRGIDLSVQAGETLMVLGPNGVGKSTLLRVLSGVLPPKSGRVLLGGEDISKLSRPAVAKLMAVVPQMSAAACGYRVDQVVMMGRAPHQGPLQRPTSEDRQIVDGVLCRVGLRHLAARSLEQLSGGEQKLVALARALAQAPKVLLLDEASAFLDPDHAAAVYEIAASETRERGLACIAVTHDLNLATVYADRVLLLRNGRIAALGSPADVMTERNVRAAFGESLRALSDGGPSKTRYFVPRPRGSVACS